MARFPIVSPWTDEQDERLRQLAAEGVSVVKAAGALNRTLTAVHTRASKLGLSWAGVREMSRKLRSVEKPCTGSQAAGDRP